VQKSCRDTPRTFESFQSGPWLVREEAGVFAGQIPARGVAGVGEGVVSEP
jgi:hypothetical protein